MHRWLVVTAALLGALALPASAAACSRDDQAYFDGFPDASCLLTLSNTEIDTFGGLRLVTDGAVTNATWDSNTELTNGVTYETKTFGLVGASTLAVTGAGDAAALTLPTTELPLSPVSAPGLLAPASTWADSDGVADPAVVKVGSSYELYYAGVAEDGTGPAIFRLTSTDGKTWARPVDPAAHLPVLEGTPGAFDENGAFGPDVVYDPADAEAPYRMWYSGHGDVFDQIGYATSTDGVTWTKRADPVVAVGLPGSQDSFSAMHPSVLFDNGLWKMWYEGDDSNLKSIHYATSTDGLVWSKAGAVIESGSGNVEFGVFAPTVWKEGNSLEMLVGGRKEVSGGVLQTKLIAAHSQNGLDWTLGNIALNTGNGFATSNLNSPEVFLDPGATDDFKLYYSGNAANEGDSRDRIGYANNTGGTAQTQPMLDIAPRGASFDARQVSGVAAADPGGSPDELAGVYWATNEAGIPRLGAARSADGATWTKVAGQAALGSLLTIGTTNQFDQDGQSDPSLLYEHDGSAAKDYFLYFTGLENDVRTIGMTTADETATTLQPNHATWAATGNDPFLGLGTALTFDDAGVSHPSVVKLGAGSYAMYYTATGSATGTAIGRVTSTSPTTAFTVHTPVVFTGAATCDPDGGRDPVAYAAAANDVHLLYTGVERFDSDGDAVDDTTVQRTCHARSTDGVSFSRKGVVLNPSQVPYRFDERAVAPASALADATTLRVFTTGTDRTGRTRGGSATSLLPLPAANAPVAGIANGWATYQLGDETTPARDFRSIQGTSTGSVVELWMSVLQPYSTGSNRYWSRFFPVDAATAQLPLNFLLTIRGVRWQARLRGPAGTPSLGKLVIGHAPVHFAAAGTATTTDIVPPDDFTLQSWTSLTVTTDLFKPLGTGTGGVTVTVLDDAGATLVPATAITTPGQQSVSLSGIDAAAKKKLRVKFDLTSAAGDATPLVESAKVAYAAAQPNATPTPTPVATATPAPPPPPPPAVLTLAALAPKVTYGRSTLLSGRLTVGAGGIAGRAIAVLQQPVGATAPATLASVTTDATGGFGLVVKPKKKTVYSLALAGVAAPAPVTVSVAHGLTLKVVLRGRQATFTGRLAPKHVRRAVTLQRKSGTRWVRFARLRTDRRSTFKLVKRLGKGRHQFRATTGADRDHLAGRSPARKIRVR